MAQAAVDVRAPAAAGGENTTTLTNIIAQSLQSGDSQLLETALGVTDGAVIEASLLRLPTVQVPALIDALVKRVDTRPGRLAHLLPWIRGCISVHAPTLMGNAAASASLTALQTLIERRLASHEQLVKLAGRLDLLMVQVVRRGGDSEEMRRMAELIHKPVAVYQADDESGAEELDEQDEPAVSGGSDSDSDSGSDGDDAMSVDGGDSAMSGGEESASD